MNRKVVVITGAAGGIGSAIARKFALGQYCLVLADMDKEKLKDLVDELGQTYPVQCEGVCGNLMDDHYLYQIIDVAVKRFGRIDVLVNNAAWRTIETMKTIDIETWNTTLRICLTAPAFLARAAAAVMEKSSSGGCIVNVSSIMSERTPGYCPAYVAAKGGIDSLTRELAITYGRNGIRAVGVSPGMVATSMGEDYTDGKGNNISSLIQHELIDYVPACRSATAAEIAGLIYWLSSDEAAYINGTNILIDGGFSANFNKYSIKSLQFPDQF